MREVLIVCLLATTVSALLTYEEVHEEFKAFKEKYNKSYETDNEEKLRLKIYADNKLKIDKHNERYEQGLEDYAMGMNGFGDLLHHEFRLAMNKANRPNRTTQRVPGAKYNLANLTCHDQVDWRQRGAVTPVRDQGTCGSCFAFSATGALEALHFRKTGNLVPLSVQELVDCTTAQGNDGCDGGFMDASFEYIKTSGGIGSESVYPYENAQRNCRHDASKVAATCSGFVDLPSGDEVMLKEAVFRVGPVSALIDSSSDSFEFYRHGVFYNAKCCCNDLDHAVLIVGYGTSSYGKHYWIVKNSWGADWGEDGYIRMARNRRNNCGIATTASYPTD